MKSHYRLSREKGVVVLELLIPPAALASDFDELNRSVLAELTNNADAGEGVVVDLARCTYVGSAALGFLLNVRQQANDRGSTTILCGVSSTVASILRTSSIGRLFVQFDSRDAAITYATRRREAAD